MATDKVRVKVLRASDGPGVKEGDRLYVNYQGFLSEDGTEFDGNFDFDDFTPVPLRDLFSFVIGAGQVIDGWDEALAGRNVGDVLLLKIPAAKAYGAAGKLPKIPPNADLTFKVELKAFDPAGPQGRTDATAEDLGLGRRAVRHLADFGDGLLISPVEKFGTDNRDVLIGTAAVDVLIGLKGKDRLQGGQSGDLLIGGRGADRFVYINVADSPEGEGSRDRIADFSTWQGDVLDLRALPGKLTDIGAQAFTGQAGEVRFSPGLLQVDLTGDGEADFEIRMHGVLQLSDSSLLL